MKRGIFAGTFDPITKGHEEIIQKASNLFDEVIVALCINSKKSATFTKEERLEFLKLVCAKYKNVKVVYHEGLLVDLLKKENAIYNVRGLRNGKDFDYENEMNFINNTLMPEMITVYIPCNVTNICVSSTAVRELLAFNKDVSQFLPQEIAEKFSKN